MDKRYELDRIDFDASTIQIPYNWVLVKLDKDHDTYHSTDTGLNTGIHVAPFGINQASHLAVTGVVVKAPDRLNFLGEEMDVIKQYRDRSNEVQKRVAELRRQSMTYDVPIEVPEGYRVYFEYTTRLNAFKEGRAIVNEHGKFVFIPYDLLIMAFKPTTDFNNVQIPDVYMLNGSVLIKPLEYATENAAGIKGVRTESDIFVPVQPDAKYVKKGNVWYANVLAAGCLVRSYADFPKAGWDSEEIGKPGQKIIYDGRQQKRLEVEHHRVIFKSHTLYRIHRKDIFGWFPDGDITGKLKI